MNHKDENEKLGFINIHSWKAGQDQIITSAYVESTVDLETEAIVPHELVSDDETRIDLTTQPKEVVCLGVST